MARICLRLKVSGLVHGVFFRATLASIASDEGVAGWVKNVPDGSVEALLEGDDKDVLKLLEWAKRGPPGARVDSVKVEKQPVRNLRGFRIE